MLNTKQTLSFDYFIEDPNNFAVSYASTAGYALNSGNSGGGDFWPLSGSTSTTGNVIINNTNNSININSSNSSRLTAINQTGSTGNVGLSASYSPLSKSMSFTLAATGGILGSQSNTTYNLNFDMGHNSDAFVIGSTTADFLQSQRINFSTFKIEDFRTVTKGIEYGADYSASYTTRSLVDKAYVDAAVSDEILKYVDGPLLSAESMKILREITPISFKWNRDILPGEHSEQVFGFSAQQVKEILPQLVTVKDNGYLAIRKDEFLALLVSAVKDLDERVSDLELKLKEERS